jgi:hypothetical protein
MAVRRRSRPNKEQREALSRRRCAELGKEHPDDPTPPMKKCVLRCGHEQMGYSGVDPTQRDCWICIWRSRESSGSERFNKAMTRDEIESLRFQLMNARGDELYSLYREKVAQCYFERPEIPSARRMQELVQVWREIWKRHARGR